MLLHCGDILDGLFRGNLMNYRCRCVLHQEWIEHGPQDDEHSRWSILRRRGVELRHRWEIQCSSPNVSNDSYNCHPASTRFWRPKQNPSSNRISLREDTACQSLIDHSDGLRVGRV